MSAAESSGTTLLRIGQPTFKTRVQWEQKLKAESLKLKSGRTAILPLLFQLSAFSFAQEYSHCFLL
jgi:hypothetical protein